MAEALAVLGLVVGVPGLFQSCVHGYRTLISSIHIGKDSAVLFTQLRIQQGRLIDIGKTWGLSVSDGGNVSSVPQLSTSGLVDQMKQQSAEAISPLVVQILNQISDLLSDGRKLSERYGLVSGDVEVQTNIAEKLQEQEKPKSVSALKRLRWSITDKGDLAQLIKDLTTFNDALERYVPIQQRRGLELALPLHFSNVQSVNELETLRQASERYQSLQQLLDLRTFRINSESNKPRESMQKKWSSLKVGTLTEKDLKKPRIPATFALESVFSVRNIDVLLEWKGYDESWDEEKRIIIRERIEALARLLQRVGHVQNLQVLECIGFVDDVPHSRVGFILALPSGQKNNARHRMSNETTKGPADAPQQVPTGLRQQVTLYSMLGSEMQFVPELGERFSMAIALCRTVLQLHAVGWLHKGIRSENVLFVDSHYTSNAPTSSEPSSLKRDLTSLWLVGFDYSRPDTESAMTETLTTYSKLQDIYRHPDSIRVVGAANPVTTRYRRAFDVYSLGCVLLEIGLWVKLEEAWKDKYSQHSSIFRQRLVEVWSKDLARKCGKTYESVVRACLQGIEPDPQSESASGKIDLEIFHRDIVSRLQSCVV